MDGIRLSGGPDGLSRFEELHRWEAADTAILYACDLIGRDGEDLRNLPFLDRKNALARLLRNTEARILFNEHIAETALSSSRAPADWAPRASVPRGWTAPTRLARAASGSGFAIPPASPCNGSGARFGIAPDGVYQRRGGDPLQGRNHPRRHHVTLAAREP